MRNYIKGVSEAIARLNNMTNEAWNRIHPKTEKPNTLRCPWADIMVRYMKETSDYCTFHFSRHYIAKENYWKHNIPVVFYACGNCIFEDCACKFKLKLRRGDSITPDLELNCSDKASHALFFCCMVL